MEPAAPTIHPISRDQDTAELVRELTARERTRSLVGVHVIVHVDAGGNVGYARVNDERSEGHGSQRWLRHARRGASPGGWSELHHPRNEQEVGAWKERSAEALDHLLIDYSKRAWRLDQPAPYLVEFAPVELAACGID